MRHAESGDCRKKGWGDRLHEYRTEGFGIEPLQDSTLARSNRPRGLREGVLQSRGSLAGDDAGRVPAGSGESGSGKSGRTRSTGSDGESVEAPTERNSDERGSGTSESQGSKNEASENRGFDETAHADLDAIRRIAKGDSSAYDEIVARHAPTLRRVVTSIVADPHGAEDVVQEVFLIAYRKLDGFRGEAPFGAWLYRIAVREARRARSKWRKVWKLLAPLELAEERAKRDYVEELDSLTGSAAIDSELGQALQLLQRLPQRSRVAFVLHVVEGFSYDEIGEVLGCTSGTVGSLIHRARAKLAQMTGNKRAMPRDGRIPAL